MSHSRIFQITPKPVVPGKRITEEDFHDHWFLNSVADYVNDDVNRLDDCKWLSKRLENVAIFDAPDSFAVLSGGKEAYFAKIPICIV